MTTNKFEIVRRKVNEWKLPRHANIFGIINLNSERNLWSKSILERRLRDEWGKIICSAWVLDFIAVLCSWTSCMRISNDWEGWKSLWITIHGILSIQFKSGQLSIEHKKRLEHKHKDWKKRVNQVKAIILKFHSLLSMKLKRDFHSLLESSIKCNWIIQAERVEKRDW